MSISTMTTTDAMAHQRHEYQAGVAYGLPREAHGRNDPFDANTHLTSCLIYRELGEERAKGGRAGA